MGGYPLANERSSMSRTIRKNGRDGREDHTITGVRPWHRRERKHARKETSRQLRNDTRAALDTLADPDATPFPVHRRTGGWLTH